MKSCRDCVHVRPLLKSSENDYWVCTYAPIPRPHVELINRSMRPGVPLLSVGNPDSAYAELCAAYQPREEAS